MCELETEHGHSNVKCSIFIYKYINVDSVKVLLCPFYKQINPDCFDRPCGEYQVCVPGQLTSGVTQTTGCSFSCIDVARKLALVL